jgi:hypothetical protein
MIAVSAVCLVFTHFNAASQDVRLSQSGNTFGVADATTVGFRAGFTFSDFNRLEVKTPQGIFTRILVPSYARSGVTGQPELPVRSEMIELPGGDGARVSILRIVSNVYTLEELGIAYPLIPRQNPVAKTGDPAPFAYDPSSYATDAFFPTKIAGIDYLGVMRGVSLGRLDIFPVQYNPARGEVRIIEELEIEITYDDYDTDETDRLKMQYCNHYFRPVFGSLPNFSRPQTAARENFTRYPVKYVIVADRMFESQLQPFIEWKNRKGFQVIEAYTDDPSVGTTTYQIKAYLQGLYDNATPDNPAPSFVLFVGDISQVPAWTGQAAGHVTDLYYCEYTGDYFPEVFYGRFSAQNPAQLQPQIDKTLMYEQYTMPEPAYLDTVVMIAGMDGTFGPTHGNGQINYGTINYFNTSNGLYSHTYLYPGSGSNSANIRQNISDGVTFANYTAHGSPDGWADPSFTVGHIPALQNDGKYGLLVGNCCSTSEYQVAECFGEALLRAANKGAVGYIGASNSTYWDEDYYFGVGVGQIAGNPPSYEETTLGYYDRAFHSHGEPFGDWYTTSGQMIYAGNLAVTLGSPGSAEYYWEAYCLMGDPSLMVYFGVAPAMTVTYDALIPLGSPVFEVNAAPYAYVAISMNGTCYDAVLADSLGLAVLEVSGLLVPGMADIVVTAQNYQPWQGQVLVANPEGPYVTLNQYIAHDFPNANGMIEMGEEVKIDMELKNWGNSDAADVTATLISTDDYITVSDNTEDYGTISQQDSVMRMEAFLMQVDEFIPDQHLVLLDVVIEDGTREVWNSSFSLTLNAPVMEIGSLVIDDTAEGNGNLRLDAGETADLILNCHNTGHCDASDVLASLQSASPYITLHNTSVSMETLTWNNMHQATFTITLADSIETGTVIDLAFTQTSGLYSDQKVFLPQVGLVLEDFESAGFATFGWIQSGDQPWTISGEGAYEGLYSARSGEIGDNENSTLIIDLDVVVDDSISFYRKVSCEDDPGNDNYDWLAFYMNDTEVERWDGEIPWGRVAYPVPAGQYTFKWVFNKDYSVASGADAAWIDYIVFPVSSPAVGLNEKPSSPAPSMLIWPNPVAGHCRIEFDLKIGAAVDLAITDLEGRTVAQLASGQQMLPGKHLIELETGSMRSGVYFCNLQAGESRITKKIIVIK